MPKTARFDKDLDRAVRHACFALSVNCYKDLQQIKQLANTPLRSPDCHSQGSRAPDVAPFSDMASQSWFAKATYSQQIVCSFFQSCSIIRLHLYNTNYQNKFVFFISSSWQWTAAVFCSLCRELAILKTVLVSQHANVPPKQAAASWASHRHSQVWLVYRNTNKSEYFHSLQQIDNECCRPFSGADTAL